MNSQLQLPHEETHVWDVALIASSDDLSYLQQTLSQDERRTAARYYSAVHRERYIIAHGALRSLLSRYTGQSPHDLQFAVSESGKPSLIDAVGLSPIQFSLSHSVDRALVAIATANPVGVDIERVDQETEILAIAERFFSSTEIAALRAVADSEQVQQFFHAWVCKEAYLKARGEGILDRLPSFSVSVTPPADACLIEDSMDAHAPSVWHLKLLKGLPTFAAAVAVPDKATHVSQMTWTPRWL